MFSSVIVLSTFVLSIVLYVIFLKYCYVPGLLISECHSWHDFTTSHFTPRMKSPKTSEQAHQMNIQVTLKDMFDHFQVPSPLTDIVILQFFTSFSILNKGGTLCTLCIPMHRGAIIHYSLTLNKICYPMNQIVPSSSHIGFQLQLSRRGACVDIAVTGAYAVTLLSIADGVLAFCIRHLMFEIKIKSHLTDWNWWAVARSGAQFSDNRNYYTYKTMH